ncbi:UBN2 domain-containing protein, partial [Cephalotus follicularis]
LIFLRHHIDDDLKYEYLTVENPLELWQNLNDRFEYLKVVVLPKVLNDWSQLRFRDFKTVSEYNSTLFKIVSQLKMCGEFITDDMLLEKTYRTFHASNVLLQQQYRLHGFKKYRELIGSLLIEEQNNELLLQNHENRHTGSAPLPEVNAT